MLHTLKIPVSEYEYQLLTVMMGPSPFNASYKNNIGKLIFSSYNSSKKVLPKKSIHNGLYFEIIIPIRWVERFGITFISDESIKDLIEHLDREFKKQLYIYIDSVLDFKEEYNKLHKEQIVAKMKDAAIRFISKNGFNEDTLKFETIKKGYKRYKCNTKTFDRVAI